MFSRIATGLILGTAAALGTSGFDAVSGLGSAGFAFALVPPEGALLAEPGAFGALAVPRAAFAPDRTLEAGFAGGLPAGLGVLFDDAAADGKLGVEADTGLGAGGAGLMAELVGGTGFGVCACFGAGIPVVAP